MYYNCVLRCDNENKINYKKKKKTICLSEYILMIPSQTESYQICRAYKYLTLFQARYKWLSSVLLELIKSFDKSVFVSPAKQRRDMYCFSGVVVVVGVNFCRVFAFRSFSQKL